MKHVDDVTSKTPPRVEEPEGVGALTERLISEAREHVEAERRVAASRGALTRVLLALTLLAATAAVATAVYGVYNFPDAPIRQSADGYVGKTGRAHTRGDYERYLNWSLAMWAVFPATFIVAAAFAYLDARDRRRSLGRTDAARRRSRE